MALVAVESEDGGAPQLPGDLFQSVLILLREMLSQFVGPNLESSRCLEVVGRHGLDRILAYPLAKDLAAFTERGERLLGPFSGQSLLYQRFRFLQSGFRD